MPYEPNIGAGSPSTFCSRITFTFPVVLAAGAQFITPVIEVVGNPYITFWARQTAGAIAATITPQFTVNLTTGGAVPVPEFRDFILAAPLPNAPVIYEYNIAARAVRVQIDADPGSNASVDLVITAHS